MDKRQLFSVMIICMSLAVLSTQVRAEEKKPLTFWGRRPSPAVFYGIRKDQKALEEKYDRKNIRHSSALQSDSSERLLKLPENYPFDVNFDIAVEPPTIDFAIIQGLEPWCFEYGESINQSPISASDGFPIWSGFGDVTKGPDGCFYFSIGNHKYYGGNAFVVHYDPIKKRQELVLNAADVTGWKPEEWSDGKIHGDLDINPEGDMMMLTFSGPRPLAKEFNDVPYSGAHLLRFNIYTGKAEDLGVPFAGDTWGYHAWDWERGILFAVGQAKNTTLIYDTNTRTPVFAGYQPKGITWWRRCIMIDRETGCIYTSNSTPANDASNTIVRWERKNNTFSEMKSRVPVHPVHGKSFQLRAHTKRKTGDGAFWCLCNNGVMFKFYPEADRVDSIGLNWGDEGIYTTNICMSPKERYLYYLPGAHSDAWKFGTPVVQFDTKTGRRKVLAFLSDFYLENYGYSPYGSYGLELDERGESLFFYTNGIFTSREIGSGYGRPALFHLMIPESERRE